MLVSHQDHADAQAAHDHGDLHPREEDSTEIGDRVADMLIKV